MTTPTNLAFGKARDLRTIFSPPAGSAMSALNGEVAGRALVQP